MERAPALILVDLQQDFFDLRVLGGIRKTVCLPGVRRLLRHAREQKWRILHVVTEHANTDSMAPRLRDTVPLYCAARSAGAEILPNLREAGDEVVTKTGYSGFGGTDLAAKVRDAAELVIGGLAVNCCVLATALDAAGTYKKRVTVPYQAVSASTAEAYQFGLSEIFKSAGNVVSLDSLTGTGAGAADSTREIWSEWFNENSRRADEIEPEYRQLLPANFDEAIALLDQHLVL